MGAVGPKHQPQEPSFKTPPIQTQQIDRAAHLQDFFMVHAESPPLALTLQLLDPYVLSTARSGDGLSPLRAGTISANGNQYRLVPFTIQHHQRQ